MLRITGRAHAIAPQRGPGTVPSTSSFLASPVPQRHRTRGSHGALSSLMPTGKHISTLLYAHSDRVSPGDADEDDATITSSSSPLSSAAGTTVSFEGEEAASILGVVNKRKQLSMQQRYRALVLTLQATARNNTLLHAIVSAVQTSMAPLMAKKQQLDARIASFLEDYDQYIAMETKARWSWEKRNRKEMALLYSIPPFIGMVLATLIYEVFIPCSVGCAVVMPLYLSWVLYDRWYLSPVVLGMLLVARWKCFEQALGLVLHGRSMATTWSWIWPGVV